MKTLENIGEYAVRFCYFINLYSVKDPGTFVIFLVLKDSTYNLRGSGVNLSMPRFNLNWMKNSFTYQVAKFWNSLAPDLRKGNLSKFVD